MTLYQSWRLAPDNWRWPNFSPQEIACRGTGKLLINEPALDRLQALRELLGKPLIINSAYRSPEHNRKVRGATNSVHLTGGAFDVSMTNHDPHAFIAAARQVGFTGIGTYPKSNFIHVDIGTPRSWGDPFPPSKQTPSFQPEPRESVSQVLAKPEVITSAGGLLGGASALAQGSGPMQYAFAVVLVIAAVVVAGIVLRRVLKRDNEGEPGAIGRLAERLVG